MPEITDPEDRAMAEGLRRAVATLPGTGGDWSGVVRGSRRRRRQELAMRTGIPALCIAVLAGGAFALGRRSGGDPVVGDQPSTTAVATTLPAPPLTTPTEQTFPLVTTVPPPVTSLVPAAPDIATAPTTTVPAGAPRPAAADWPKVGGTDAFGTAISVHATTAEGIDEVCVGAVRLDGIDAGDDACGGVDGSFAVMLAGDQLTVVGVGRDDTPVVVTTTEGEASVSTWPFAGRQVWAAVLPPGADLVSVDGSPSAADCPYRELIPVIAASGSTSAGARLAITVERCRDGVAFGSARGSHVLLQGAGVILERTGGRYELVNLGLVCERDGGVTAEGTGSISDRESAACAKVGL